MTELTGNIFYFSIILLINIISLIYRLYPPKKINSLYGYRTGRSMSSQEAWELANKIFSEKFLQLNLTASVILIFLFFTPLSCEIKIITETVFILFNIILSIVITENQLKKFTDSSK